jgi:hypothetical protein
MRNAGAAALGVTLGAGLVGSKTAKEAFATGTANSPCGPSPIAASGYCPNGGCNPPGACSGRIYGTLTCANSSGGCWTEDYRSSARGLWSCCDICANNGTGSRCSGSHCGLYGHYAAICRKKL